MTTAITDPQSGQGPYSKVGPIIVWVVLLFALTIVGALPMLLQDLNLTRISPSTPHLPLILTGMLVTSCSPTLAALLAVGLSPAAGGLRSISGQVTAWRVGSIWYVLALIGPVFPLLAAKAIYAARLGTMPAQWMVLPSLSGPGGLPFVIFGSLLAEEPGWRGFAQPRLQARYGALAAAVCIGLLWSAWHLWYVILPGGFWEVSGTDALATFLRLTSTAVIYAWMYNSTNGSLFIAMIAPRTQPRREFDTNGCGPRPATSHHRISVFCCSHCNSPCNRPPHASPWPPRVKFSDSGVTHALLAYVNGT